MVYSNHDYALAGFMDAGPYPGLSRGEYVDRDALERKFEQHSEYMLEFNIPIWVGESGPIYTGRPATDPTLMSENRCTCSRVGSTCGWAVTSTIASSLLIAPTTRPLDHEW